jgi:hypothetical protein
MIAIGGTRKNTYAEMLSSLLSLTESQLRQRPRDNEFHTHGCRSNRRSRTARTTDLSNFDDVAHEEANPVDPYSDDGTNWDESF